MKANIQATFIFDDTRNDATPEEICSIRWGKFANIMMGKRTNKKMIDMIDFVHNEHEIMNERMPFMVKKKLGNKL